MKTQKTSVARERIRIWEHT